MEAQTTKTQIGDTEPVPSTESLYRTRWLMAHQAVHTLVHDKGAKPDQVWKDYLEELGSSEEVASRPA